MCGTLAVCMLGNILARREVVAHGSELVESLVDE